MIGAVRPRVECLPSPLAPPRSQVGACAEKECLWELRLRFRSRGKKPLAVLDNVVVTDSVRSTAPT